MTLQKAIEVLEKAQEATAFVGEHPLRSAQQLGIEALKAFQCGREGLRTEFDTLLAGEIKD